MTPDPGLSSSIRLDRVRFASVTATPRSTWTFAEVTDTQGVTALTEFTFGDNTSAVSKLIADIVERLHGEVLANETQVTTLLGLDDARLASDRPTAAAISAVRTAVCVIDAMRLDIGLTEYLGGVARESVALYANINRALFASDRSPAAFAAEAERAVASGFAIVKCAPFDEATPPYPLPSTMELARPGIDRVAAVRAAVGPDIRVLVDCHSRFAPSTAAPVAKELARLDVGWFEEPVQPTTDPDGLAAIAEQVTMPVAGGENGYGTEIFASLIKRGAVSVVMPDVKYCGGVAEATRIGRAALGAGGGVSLHSPAGPVAQMAGAHVTAAVEGAMPLEYAVNEVSWRADVTAPSERIEGGRLLLPGGRGLGVELDAAVVQKYGRYWNG